ncbi:MAG: SIMPL domain-containing protein [Actinomycetota bacterium]
MTNSGTASNASGIGPVVPITTTAEGSSIASPAWCCTTGFVPGLTVMGQATIKDQGSAARDAAIAQAVADATDQAQAAADAAGIHLGAVLDLQVSAMAVVYPVVGTVGPNSGIAVGSTGSSGEGSAPGASGADATPDRYLGSATVTITWAIG